jgi:hypothetical protein
VDVCVETFSHYLKPLPFLTRFMVSFGENASFIKHFPARLHDAGLGHALQVSNSVIS